MVDVSPRLVVKQVADGAVVARHGGAARSAGRCICKKSNERASVTSELLSGKWQMQRCSEPWRSCTRCRTLHEGGGAGQRTQL